MLFNIVEGITLNYEKIVSIKVKVLFNDATSTAETKALRVIRT